MTVASAANEVVIDTVSYLHTAATTITSDAGQTQLWYSGTSGGGTNANVRAAASMEPGSASTLMSWTLSASDSWAIRAVALRPA